jgi:DNA-binding PadR family transcriptional regulator
MEQAGLVSHERQTQEKRPDRKVFSLTPAGRKKFKAWVKAPVEHVRDLRLEFLAKVHFLEKGDQQSLQKLFAAQQEVCQEKMDRLVVRKDLANSRMERLTCEFRLSLSEAALAWLRQLK